MMITIAGTGRALPEKRVTNFDMAELVETSDEWIRERTGIVERRIATEDSVASLSAKACQQALEMAVAQNLDLVLIAPKATPPVCKLMDYGKYCFEQQKREKEAKKNQKVITIKEVQLSVTIEQHDMMVKAKKAIEFLNAGNKVKVTIRFLRRQIAHPELGIQVMEQFYEMIKDHAVMERKPKVEGRNAIMILTSTADKADKS